MRRKVIASALGSAFALSVLAPSAIVAQDKPEVLVWTDSVRQPGFEAYRDLVADEVDVKVEIQDINQVLGKIQLANAAGSGWPDVIFADPSDLALLVSPQIDYALEWTPEAVGQDFLDAFGEGNIWCEIDGKTWCVKNDLAQSVLWYDTVVFEELGLTVPTTMEEWAAEAMKLEGTGYVAGALGDEGFYANFLWPSGCPTALPVSDSEVRINGQDPACTRVADLIQPLVDAGVLDRRGAFDAGFLADVAQQGKVAMTFGPSWFGDFVIRPEASWAVPEGRITTAPMPIWEGEDVAYSGEWGGGLFIVSNKAKYPEAAIDTAKWMVSDPDHVRGGPTFPAYGPANVIWTERIAEDPYYVGDATEAMTIQSQLINPVVGPVRVDVYNQIGADLALPITQGQPIQAAIDQFTQALKNLAPQVGYNVSD
jgi:multiple sugar transport system substrate-binding protein